MWCDNERDYEHVNVETLSAKLSEQYRVDISPQDLVSAKRISKSGTVQIAFKDVKPDSKYRQLVTQTKSKGANKKGEKIYANFTLTNRRNSLLYVIRGAWRDKM